jgi:hypothetical protein
VLNCYAFGIINSEVIKCQRNHGVEFIKAAIDKKYTFKVIGDFLEVSQSAVSGLLLDKGINKYILDL